MINAKHDQEDHVFCTYTPLKIIHKSISTFNSHVGIANNRPSALQKKGFQPPKSRAYPGFFNHRLFWKRVNMATDDLRFLLRLGSSTLCQLPLLLLGHSDQ